MISDAARVAALLQIENRGNTKGLDGPKNAPGLLFPELLLPG
jgi:hypothetical protein